MVWPLVMVLSSRETALNGIRNPDEKVTLIPSVWRIQRWPPGPAEYRYPHPSRGRAGPCKQRPISRDLQKRTTLWPVGDAPSVRPDRSARYLDDQEFSETPLPPRDDGPAGNKPSHAHKPDTSLQRRNPRRMLCPEQRDRTAWPLVLIRALSLRRPG